LALAFRPALLALGCLALVWDALANYNAKIMEITICDIRSEFNELVAMKADQHVSIA